MSQDTRSLTSTKLHARDSHQRPSLRSHTLVCMLTTSTANMSTGVTSEHLLTMRAWTPGKFLQSAFLHNATKTKGSSPQWSGEALELSQGWLEALLSSHRWIRWEIATSRHIKYWEGIPGLLREPTIRGQTMYTTWPPEKLCAILGQRVRDTLSLFHPSPSGDWLW